jgi:nicotinamidase-related amidase/flavin reductase (DIM6/NTAB) family NADH-FMN oxidoreductase RutF
VSIEGADLRQAMRVFATGVTVVLTKPGDDVHGMTANAVCSISLEPPLVMLSLDNRTKMHAALEDGDTFSINVLEARQSTLADRFAGRWVWSADSVEFDYVDDTPIIGGSLASMTCRVDSRIPAGDHTMIMGLVLEARSTPGTPLIFFNGKWTSFPGPEDVFMLDRNAFREEMRRDLTVEPETTALVAIDMTRGHLDPTLATMPLPPQAATSVVERSRTVYDAMRARGCPVVHVTLHWTPENVEQNPFYRAVDAMSSGLIPWRKTRIRDHNPLGSPQAAIVDELAPLPGECVIDDKHRLSAFFGTRLEETLNELGIDTIVLVGVNTNTSILHTAFDAFCRDFKVVVLSDCTISMYGPDLHELALKNIEYALGWVTLASEFLPRLEHETREPLPS